MEEATTRSNFVWEAVEQDLKDGRYTQVHTRFPPEPNGYMHIGHCKALITDFLTAEKFGGKCNLRFDDTNPAKEDTEFVEAIKNDIHWLGFDWTGGLYYASDYYDKCYEIAEDWIRRGLAYVDELNKEQMREYRGTLTKPGKNSPWRDRPAEESLDLFRRMRAGEFAEGQYTLRAKIDMASPNIVMRDPTMYRILYKEHWRTGKKWCIYPMYDFAHPIGDALEGISHSLCSLEYEIHRPLYDWVVEHSQSMLPARPRQIEFARLNMTRTVMSKRKLRALVMGGYVKGWDDPRMPTLSGLHCRCDSRFRQPHRLEQGGFHRGYRAAGCLHPRRFGRKGCACDGGAAPAQGGADELGCRQDAHADGRKSPEAPRNGQPHSHVRQRAVH